MIILKLNKACAVIHSCKTLEQLSVAERYLDLCKLSGLYYMQAKILLIEKRAVICRQISDEENTNRLNKLFKNGWY